MDAATPGEHHRYLDSLVGSWEGEFKITMEPGSEPFTSQGTIEREWVLGGRFLKETVTATSDMGPFNGLAYLGYNNGDGRYEMVWMEDHATAMYFETGTVDPETKIMLTRGSHRDPRTGKLINAHGKLDFSNPDRHVYISYATGPDGKEYQSFWGETVRKQIPGKSPRRAPCSR